MNHLKRKSASISGQSGAWRQSRAGRVARCLLAILLLGIPAHAAWAERVLVAVASNFAGPMQALADRFESESEHEIDVATGASGRFYAQISNGAPFQIFFSADQAKPLALVEAGLAEAASRFTYARGRLVLWSADANREIDSGGILNTDSYRRLALANPLIAPYGQAALQVLDSLQARESTRTRWVQGENIAQTFQFVSTGNAELGFVALSQVGREGELASGSGWIIPESLHEAIRQDAVLLNNAVDCGACREFLDFVRSESGRRIIQRYGYQ